MIANQVNRVELQLEKCPRQIPSITIKRKHIHLSAEDKYKHQYYKTWASYNIPMRPVDPIDYIETELLNSFYLAYYNQDKQLVRFIKYLLEKKAIEEKQLSETKAPHSIIYFESIDAEVGKEISYSATENYTFYYIIEINSLKDYIHFYFNNGV